MNIRPEIYSEYIVLENGAKVLYVKLKRLDMGYCAVHFYFAPN